MTALRRNNLGYIVALFLSTLFVIVAAFGAGWTANVLMRRFDVGRDFLPDVAIPSEELAPADATGGESAAPTETDGDMAVFWEALELLDEHFYAQEEVPQGDDVTYAAIEGVVEATGDPHTGFMDPERAEMVEEGLEGEYEGIGAQVDVNEEGLLVIIAPFPNTPAEEAGLQAGDVVLEIDGTPTQGMTAMEAASLVRGEGGTTVHLTVRRDGTEELLEFDVTRATITIPVTESRLIEEEGLPPLGYLRLYDFGGRSTEQFTQDLQALLDGGAEALIVDLRNNPGGFLDASVDITSQFIGEGLILTEKGTNGRDNEYPAEPGGIALDIPLVVLVNEGSASASEIFAGAIQDHERGTLIGTTTFGKGSVQITRDLSDQSSLRVTIARWFTPSGDAIHEVGVTPDVVVEVDPDTLEEGEDPQLDAAIEFFRNADEE